MSYHWEQSDRPGSWVVSRQPRIIEAFVDIEVTDCGCCGSVDIMHSVESVQEFDERWEALGQLLRERVIEGLEAEQ